MKFIDFIIFFIYTRSYHIIYISNSCYSRTRTSKTNNIFTYIAHYSICSTCSANGTEQRMLWIKVYSALDGAYSIQILFMHIRTRMAYYTYALFHI